MQPMRHLTAGGSHGELFLRHARALWRLGGRGRLRLVLAANHCDLRCRLAAVLRPRTLGLYRLRLVLDFGLFVGLGDLSLRPLVSRPALRLVLVAGHDLGAVVGDLALRQDYCGWAPLPPHAVYRPGVGILYHGAAVSAGFDFGLSVGAFTFVPTRDFCDPHPRRLSHRSRRGDAHLQSNRPSSTTSISTATTKASSMPASRYAKSPPSPGGRFIRSPFVTRKKTRARPRATNNLNAMASTLMVNRPHFVGSPVLTVQPGTVTPTGHRQNEFHPTVRGNENNISPALGIRPGTISRIRDKSELKPEFQSDPATNAADPAARSPAHHHVQIAGTQRNHGCASPKLFGLANPKSAPESRLRFRQEGSVSPGTWLRTATMAQRQPQPSTTGKPPGRNNIFPPLRP